MTDHLSPFRTSAETDQIDPALAVAIAQLSNVRPEYDGQVGSRTYKYVGLGSVVSHVREVLGAHGIVVMQASQNHPDHVTVTTRLLHSTGQWVETAFTLGAEPSLWFDPQRVASVNTYARRYGLCNMVGIAPDLDDDGAAASAAAAAARDAAQAAPSPFDDPNRDPLLATKAQHDAIRGMAAALTPEQRNALTSWRTSAGISLSPAELTAAQAGEVIARINAFVSPAGTPPGGPADGDQGDGVTGGASDPLDVVLGEAGEDEPDLAALEASLPEPPAEG